MKALGGGRGKLRDVGGNRQWSEYGSLTYTPATVACPVTCPAASGVQRLSVREWPW
jgi:hypothetical protein